MRNGGLVKFSKNKEGPQDIRILRAFVVGVPSLKIVCDEIEAYYI